MPQRAGNPTFHPHTDDGAPTLLSAVASVRAHVIFLFRFFFFMAAVELFCCVFATSVDAHCCCDSGASFFFSILGATVLPSVCFFSFFPSHASMPPDCH